MSQTLALQKQSTISRLQSITYHVDKITKKNTHEVTITVKQSMQVLDKMTKSPLMASIMTMHAFKGMSSSSLFFGLLQHDVIVYQTNYKTILWSFCKVLLQLTKT